MGEEEAPTDQRRKATDDRLAKCETVTRRQATAEHGALVAPALGDADVLKTAVDHAERAAM